jgi:tetratricopeptide (TPR) repeat protein
MPTMSLQRVFELALQHHRAGRLAEARRIYLQIMAQVPDDPDALQLLGLIAHDEGRHEEAVDLIGRAAALKPAVAEYRSNLGVALWGAGRGDEALAAYNAALALVPDYADAHYNLACALKALGRSTDAVAAYREVVRLQPGMAETHISMAALLVEQGKLEEAALSYQQALQIKPDDAGLHFALGNALHKLRRPELAAAAFTEATRLEPHHPDCQNNLANVLRVQGQLGEAEAHYRTALQLNPGSPEIRLNLGNVLLDQWRLDEAAACYRQVLELNPGHADALNSLGNTLSLQGKLDQAVGHYREALRLRPAFPVIYVNMGNALRCQGKLAEAVATYEQALQLQPDYPAAHWNRSLALLSMGQYESGWQGYDWRWLERGQRRPAYLQPFWDGSPLGGRTILLYVEQGLGDTIQFIRFAPRVQQLGGRVVVICQRPLVQLLSGCAGIDKLVAEEDPLPGYDLQAGLMDLPRILRMSFAGIPAQVPYVVPDADRVAHWRRELGSSPGFKVGIVWQGNPKFSTDKLRSIPLAEYAPLVQVPVVRLFSLQKGPGTEQLDELRGRIPIVDLAGPMDATRGMFVEEAAAMMGLDLVITSDTSMAHLAGALGRPTWVALPFAADWRWLLGRTDSPWYPTMRLFRQDAWGDWRGVFARIAAALADEPGT